MSNETQSDDFTKPMLCDVAVLSAYRVNFNLWVKENRKEGERYHYISGIKDVAGKTFHRVEKSHMWSEMPDCIIVQDYCLSRVRNTT